MRLAGAQVRFGGIVGVKTKPAARGSGYGRTLMAAAVDYMAEHGYPVSVLFGIPDFYHRFGYATFLAHMSQVRVKTAAAERLPMSLEVRQGSSADAEALLAVYEAQNGMQDGSMYRTRAAFSPWLVDDDEWWQEPRRILVAEDNGRPVAYALGDPEWRYESEWFMRPYEIAALPGHGGSGCASLVRKLAAEAGERREEWVSLEMLPNSPLLGPLRPIGFTQEIEYSHNQGGMGRIIDLAALAAVLETSLKRRALPAGVEEEVGRIDFICDGQRTTIELGAGSTISIDLQQQHLLQLLMGYRSIEELRLEFPDCVAEQDVGVVNTLFPEGHPYMWRLDHF
jgi:predicted acetyltransferase